VKSLLVPVVMLVSLSGCGTDPSTVDLTGNWLIIAHSHAADLREDQQSCTLRHGLIVSADTTSTVIGAVHGLLAQGDTTGTFQCVLYGKTGSPTPYFRSYFVVTRSGEHVAVYQRNNGLLAYEGDLRNEDRMNGRVGLEVLGVGTWYGFRRSSE
jgi:hypothetical protein